MHILKFFFLALANVNREFVRPTEDQISNVISVIRRVYPQIENQFCELAIEHRFYDEHIRPTTQEEGITSEKQLKHLIQLGSIIGKGSCLKNTVFRSFTHLQSFTGRL